MRPSAIAITAILAASSSFHVNASELAKQLDIVAPLVNAGDLESLGGPDHPEGIVSGIDGRWFTLNNTTRNWGDAGVGFGPDDLNRSRERSCADDAEDTTSYRATGPTSFDVLETFGRYGTSLTQSLSWREGRRFDIAVDEDELLGSYGITRNDEVQAQEILQYVDQLAEEGIELWRPTEDILVVTGSFGVDVTGRC